VLRWQPKRPPAGSPDDCAATGCRRAWTTTPDPPGRHRQPPSDGHPAVLPPLRARKASDSTVLFDASEPTAWQTRQGLGGALPAGGAFARPHPRRRTTTGAPTTTSGC